MVRNEANVPRCLCKIGPGYEAMTYYKQSKLEGLQVRE